MMAVFRNWSVYQDRGPRWVGPYVPNTSQWSQHRSSARFQNSARNAKTRSVESVQQCQKIRQKQTPGGRLPLSPVPTPKQAGNTRATCRGIVDKGTALEMTYNLSVSGTVRTYCCGIDNMLRLSLEALLNPWPHDVSSCWCPVISICFAMRDFVFSALERLNVAF